MEQASPRWLKLPLLLLRLLRLSEVALQRQMSPSAVGLALRVGGSGSAGRSSEVTATGDEVASTVVVGSMAAAGSAAGASVTEVGSTVVEALAAATVVVAVTANH